MPLEIGSKVYVYDHTGCASIDNLATIIGMERGTPIAAKCDTCHKTTVIVNVRISPPADTHD